VIPKMGSGPVVPAAPASEPDGDGPSFIQALRDQLGLKLESTKGLVETLVIDHVEDHRRIDTEPRVADPRLTA
jgi:uncharacterized protein (TIGR03435 family)